MKPEIKVGLKHIPYKDIWKAYKAGEIKENEPFLSIYEDRKSNFIVLRGSNETWSFSVCVIIKDSVTREPRCYESDWFIITDNQVNMPRNLKYAVNQIAILMTMGWAFLEEKEDEYGFNEKWYRCVYCALTKEDPSRECVCRQVARKMKRGKIE